jgi:hypothetical protein
MESLFANKSEKCVFEKKRNENSEKRERQNTSTMNYLYKVYVGAQKFEVWGAAVL